MNTVTADEAVQPFFSNLKGLTIIRDKSGKTLGRFYPGEMSEDEAYAAASKLFDPAEIARRKAEPGGRTTAEVLARLHSSESKS